MLKLMSFFKHKPGMSVEDFQAYWCTTHAEVVVTLAGQLRQEVCADDPDYGHRRNCRADPPAVPESPLYGCSIAWRKRMPFFCFYTLDNSLISLIIDSLREIRWIKNAYSGDTNALPLPISGPAKSTTYEANVVTVATFGDTRDGEPQDAAWGATRTHQRRLAEQNRWLGLRRAGAGGTSAAHES